jgi:isopenicillin N synthase-like dioxygenase
VSGAPRSLGERPTERGLPVVDVEALVDPDGSPERRAAASDAIDRACRRTGFFAISGHGVDPQLLDRLDRSARAFFAQPDHAKRAIAMERAGSAWRGWFPVDGELTSGTPDHKEGIYFGCEHSPDDPRVASGTPLHGPNQFPVAPTDLGPNVLEWLDAMRPVADAVMRGIAVGLGLAPTWFEEHLTGDPTELFRIFHYPPNENGQGWGVGEHTDYGLLTLLAQDDHGGLQVQDLDGRWIDVDADTSLLVCNIGDMLERLTGSRYRSTPHRVRNTSGASRLSFPYFFDPSWDATVPTLPLPDAGAGEVRALSRWDGDDVLAWEGTYGEYLTTKVAKVFPELFSSVHRQR